MTTNQTTQKPQSVVTSKWISRIFSLLVTAVLLFFLIRQVEQADFSKLLAALTPLSIVGAAGAYLLLNFFRALRFRALLEKPETPLALLFPITLYHNFLVRVLPFKLGELSYIIMLKNRLNYAIQEGVSSLLGARLLELLIIVVVFGIALIASGSAIAGNQSMLILLIVGSMIGCIAVFYFMGRVLRWSIVLLQYITNRVTSTPSGVILKLIHSFNKIADALDGLRKPRLFLPALFYTLFTYACSFVTFMILLVAVGVEVQPPVMIMIISLGMFASAFPFTISGFGVVELSWAFGLVQFAGYPLDEATAIGFLLHGFQVIAATAYGIIGYALVHMQTNKE